MDAPRATGTLVAMVCIGCWLLGTVRAVAETASTAEPVVVQGSPGGHLHLDRHITNAAYRQQVLALTPLGSTHEHVKACVLEEWRFGKQPINEYMVGGQTRLANYIPLSEQFSALVNEEPPHIPLDRQHPFVRHEGWRYMHATFSRDKVFGRPQVSLFVIYVFDKRNRLIDVFTVGQGPSRPFW